MIINNMPAEDSVKPMSRISAESQELQYMILYVPKNTLNRAKRLSF
jgi:hypothetical protein